MEILIFASVSITVTLTLLAVKFSLKATSLKKELNIAEKKYKALVEHNRKHMGFIHMQEQTSISEWLFNNHKLFAEKREELLRAHKIQMIRMTYPGRRVGNSTRQIDYYVQMFWLLGELKKSWIVPHENVNEVPIRGSKYQIFKDNQDKLFRFIRRRLDIEHFQHCKPEINNANHIKLKRHA